ncbi:hypothetical protein ADUPG1_010027, partial [Aduncisulcus paluster]
VQKACEKVQSIKRLLPKIGEGWKCPSIDDIVKAQLAKHKGDTGSIVDEDSIPIWVVVLPKGWGDGLSRSEEEPEKQEVERRKLEEKKRKREKLEKTETERRRKLEEEMKMREFKDIAAALTITPNPQILTSDSDITPLCIIGSGGFGDVILARIDYPESSSPSILCALKCMKVTKEYEGKDTTVQLMKRNFSLQCRWYSSNPLLQSGIPRPLHMLDFLDDDLKGTFGMAMEFCQGGNVIEFAKSWAVDLEECDPCDPDEDDLVYDPVKIAALCVAIIECVADIFSVKKRFIHRDIKPDNFLVRYDVSTDKCHVLLGDLGCIQIRDIEEDLEGFEIRDSMFLDSWDEEDLSSSKKVFPYCKPSIVGTLCYTAPESLKSGFYCQRSDAWGVILTIWSLFNRMRQPFMLHPMIHSIPYSSDYFSNLCSRLRELIAGGECLPQLKDSEIFCSLETMEDGKYKKVYQVFLAVFDGLLSPDRLKRMTIHQARSLTDEIKHLLPRIGEGWECPSIEEYIARQLEEYDGCTGTIHCGGK